MARFTDGYLPSADPTYTIALDAYVGSWLGTTVQELASRSRNLCKAKDSGISVTIQPMAFALSNRAYVNIYQIGGELPHNRIEQWAFDYTFTVPLGGYTAPIPPGYFVYHLPGGVTRRFRRAYVKQSGMTIKRKGYFSEAARQVFTSSYMDGFGTVIAGLTGKIIANRLVEQFRSKGYNAESVGSA